MGKFDPSTLNFTVKRVTTLEGIIDGSVYVAETNMIYVLTGCIAC